MKIRPVILCGGAGTRLWPQSKNNVPKQFVDFGGWNLFKKSLERIKKPAFDYPIISTNLKYLKNIKKNLKDCNIKKYIIILEPAKRNTAPAILASALIKEIPDDQPLMFFAADHLIEKNSFLTKSQLAIRRKQWKAKKSSFGSGTIWKYAQTVGPAYLGAPTHPGKRKEVKVYADI